jgi:hypothetical protein
MSSLPATDALLNAVAKLEALAKKRIAAARRGERCICSCHDDPSIIHVGRICCERAVGD